MLVGFRTILASVLSALVGAGIITQAQGNGLLEFLGGAVVVLNGIAVFYKWCAVKREEYLKRKVAVLNSKV